jgi:hypothetical protein
LIASFSDCRRSASAVSPALLFLPLLLLPGGSDSTIGSPDSISSIPTASLLLLPDRCASSPFHALLDGGCELPDVGGEMLAGLRCSGGLEGDFAGLPGTECTCSPGKCDVVEVTGGSSWKGGMEALISRCGTPYVTRTADEGDIASDRGLFARQGNMPASLASWRGRG